MSSCLSSNDQHNNSVLRPHGNPACTTRGLGSRRLRGRGVPRGGERGSAAGRVGSRGGGGGGDCAAAGVPAFALEVPVELPDERRPRGEAFRSGTSSPPRMGTGAIRARSCVPSRFGTDLE